MIEVGQTWPSRWANMWQVDEKAPNNSGRGREERERERRKRKSECEIGEKSDGKGWCVSLECTKV